MAKERMPFELQRPDANTPVTNATEIDYADIPLECGLVYDISVAHAVNNVPAQYESLSAALGTSGANIPQDVRRGGMAVKYINSGSGKYEQWVLKASSFSTTESDWECSPYQGDSDADFDIADENGKVILRIEGGHLKTKYFDSETTATSSSDGLMSSDDKSKLDSIEPNAEVNDVETCDSTDSDADFDIADENGKVILQIGQGGLRTKNFNSATTPSEENTSNADFEIIDENDNVLLQLRNGHIRTKYFDSIDSGSGGSGSDSDFVEYQKYNRGGADVSNVASASDIKMFTTLKHIIADCPYADIILIANFYAGQSTDKNAKRRTYKEELKAVASFLSLSLIELDSLGIIRKGVSAPGIYTVDGVHAYTISGATKIYNYIRGVLDARYNDTLTSKKILILGDSSCVENPGTDRTTWSKILKDAMPSGNVDIRALGGTSWLYTAQGQIDNTNNIECQFDRSAKDADIIIITAGGNELNYFNLDYEGTLKYLMTNY